MHDIHGRGDPFRECVVGILRLAGRSDLLLKDVEDGLGGLTGLKPRKERVLGNIFLGLTFVSFQSRIKNGRKI
jgi:hypothetical protein